jgi:chemotaxis protein methyltransferase CheR
MTITVQSAASIVGDKYFSPLRDYIISATGLVIYADQPEALAGHIATRLEKRGLTGCFTYLKMLQDEHTGEVELDHLIALLTIGETYFFRHRELFDALRDVALPEILDRNRITKRLRVWSAGCSTGAEAYSVSILLRRDLRDSFQNWNMSIVGTDINRPFLSLATEGSYEEWAFRGTTAELRRECFEQQGKAWRIDPRFKEAVTFQYHNLVRHPFPSLVQNLLGFDLILCRNVLIYFAPEIAERIILDLAECLVPGGWLAVGHAEYGLHLHKTFEVVNCGGATLYRKLKPSERRSKPIGLMPQQDIPIQLISVPDPPFYALLTQQSATRFSGSLSPHGNSAPSAPHQYKSRTSPPCLDVENIRTLADKGNVDTALQLCETLIAKNPINPSFYFYQALLLDQVEGHDAALLALNKVIYLNREFELAHYYLGLTQQKLGNAPDAIKSFRNALKLLEGRDRSERLPDAEGLTIADLDEVTRMHLETLEEICPQPKI